jgi:hypothetical protein
VRAVVCNLCVLLRARIKALLLCFLRVERLKGVPCCVVRLRASLVVAGCSVQPAIAARTLPHDPPRGCLRPQAV